MFKREIKLGIIGESEGNGHPFSWQAICNGYNRETILNSGYPIINKYLEAQNWNQDFIPNCKVTSIWTDNPSRSRFIASTSDCCKAYNSLDKFMENIDGVLIARDDFYHNQFLFNRIISFRKPILFDKQISFNKETTKKIITDSVHQKVPIFSGSPIGYDKNLEIGEIITNKKCTFIKAVSPKNWFNYGIHVLDPILRNLYKIESYKFSEIINLDKNYEFIDGITLKVSRKNFKDLIIEIKTNSKYSRSFCFEGFDSKMGSLKKYTHIDTFNTFKSYLETFVEIVRKFYDNDFCFEEFLKNNEYGFYMKSIELIESGLAK